MVTQRKGCGINHAVNVACHYWDVEPVQHLADYEAEQESEATPA